MNNPLRILQTLDRHLARPNEITLFGRAALALGFADSSARFATTRDVDAILPLSWLEAKDQNLDFWEAQQKTNAELESEGLYITHLFREFEVILRPSWLTYRVPVAVVLSKLTVWRPAVLDLVLTKMARGDESDMDDIRFLLRQEKISDHDLQAAFAQARVPDVAEIRELFRAAQPKVLALANGRRL
jgi:hypothetical protein